MFENIATTEIVKQQPAQQPQQYGPQGYDDMYDPYALPIDPYLQHHKPSNWNQQMLSKLFDASLSANEITKGEYEVIFRAIVVDLRRIPNLSPQDKRRLIREMADIETLSQCGGTKGMVRSRLRKMWFEVSAHAADGSSPLTGITGVSAIITQRSQMEQQVKIPQQQEHERKKLFGII